MNAPLFIAGHSAGGARAWEYARSRIKRGLPVAGVYSFGCANPGDATIGVDTACIATRRSIKNRRDLVTDVPVDLALLDEEYVQPTTLEEGDASWSTDSGLPNWGPFNDHHIELYQAACRKLPPSGAGAAIELNDAIDAVASLYVAADGWDWLHPVDGQYWGMKRFANGARLLIARGSKTALDWVNDFDALQITVLGGRVSAGFWSGVGPIEALLDGAVA